MLRTASRQLVLFPSLILFLDAVTVVLKTIYPITIARSPGIGLTASLETIVPVASTFQLIILCCCGIWSKDGEEQ
jgi:hypothetical protein